MRSNVLDRVPTPPVCADPALSALEDAVLAAVADDLARTGGPYGVDQPLGAYVLYLRLQGAMPEHMVICVKKLLERSALARLSVNSTRAYEAHVLLHCIRVFYDISSDRRS